MAATLPSLLATLTESLESASDSLCDSKQLAPPTEGISLLDTKNELFLSYLQNLVFLIILKLRQKKDAEDEDEFDLSTTSKDVVKKLVENRIYLEKGIKPLENRLRYQIDKVVRAADDATLRQSQQSKTKSSKSRKSKHNGVKVGSDTGSGSGEEFSDGEGASTSGSDANEVDPLSFRPNLAALAGPRSKSKDPKAKRGEDPKDGVYRPPKITATVMPDPDRGERASKTQRSAHIDEFVADEMSAAPIAQPSIGTTIAKGGRHYKSTKDRKDESDRKAYEETNFVRLPAMSKKDKEKQGRQRESGWGGEEWRDLGAGADRIGSMVGRKGGSGSALERSRKRGRDDDGGAVRMGEAFDKRRKTFKKR